MIRSPEFYTSAGGSDNAYVTELYNCLLRRSAEASGLQHWVGQLAAKRQSGKTAEEARFEVAFEINRSDEGLRNLIRAWHLLYLDRPATNAELNLYLPLLKAGTSQREAQTRIINTAEYANTPPAPAAGVATRLL